VIDEAHKLSLEVLEEIRLLGNFESASDKYLQILLLGQSELDDLLNRHDLRQLKQRIALRLYIDRLTQAEVQQYIRFRWAKGGGREAPPFTADATAGIVQWSQGIPRLVNSLCDTALLMAYGDESPLVGLNYVRSAALNLALTEVSDPTLAWPHAANHLGARPPSLELSELVSRDSNLSIGSSEVPSMAGGSEFKGNSSILKRLAEKFGLQ